jgi:hypothetical membrane protein
MIESVEVRRKRGFRIGSWPGVIGPILFAAVFTVEGSLRPGYDPTSMYVSALSIGPRGWIQIANFMVFGALLLMFSRRVAAELRHGKASLAGPLLLAIIAVGLFLSGPFVMDPQDTARAALSSHGWLHLLFGAIVFTAMPTSCFVFFRRFRQDRHWRWLRVWTLVAGAVIVAAIAIQKILPVVAPDSFHNVAGLIQRVELLTYLIWIVAFATRLGCEEPPSANVLE